MEVVWKVCAAVVNFQIKRSVTLYNVLQGFTVGSGMGKVTLEGNLAQQLLGIAHKLLFQVFLDVQKVYNSLDRGWCMEILRGYGIVQNTALLIAHHWENLIFVPKTSSFLGVTFVTGIIVTQGDPASPMIFNIVVDVVVIVVLEVVCGPLEARHRMGWVAG